MAGPQMAVTKKLIKKLIKKLNLFIYLLFHFACHSIRPNNRAVVGMRTFFIVKSISYFNSYCSVDWTR